MDSIQIIAAGPKMFPILVHCTLEISFMYRASSS